MMEIKSAVQQQEGHSRVVAAVVLCCPAHARWSTRVNLLAFIVEHVDWSRPVGEDGRGVVISLAAISSTSPLL